MHAYVRCLVGTGLAMEFSASSKNPALSTDVSYAQLVEAGIVPMVHVHPVETHNMRPFTNKDPFSVAFATLVLNLQHDSIDKHRLPERAMYFGPSVEVNEVVEKRLDKQYPDPLSGEPMRVRAIHSRLDKEAQKQIWSDWNTGKFISCSASIWALKGCRITGVKSSA